MTRRSLIAGALLALWACGGGAQKAPQSKPPVPVTVARVEQKAVPLSVHAFGTAEPNLTVGVRSLVPGTLQKVLFHEGEEVQEGEVLFQIDPRPFQAQLSQAEAALARDQAKLGQAEEDAKRYGVLVKKDYVTQQQAQSAVAEAASLRATVAQDKAAIDAARLNLSYCTIKAPITGRTGAIQYQLGNVIGINAATPMVTINQVRPIRVGFGVPVGNLPELRAHANQRLKVEARAGSKDHDAPEPTTSLSAPAQVGAVSFIDNNVNSSTGTILVKADFANADETLWPGEFVDVMLYLGDEPSAVVVPAQAVETGQKGTYVFVVKSDGTVDSRAVSVERQAGELSVIARGLSVGETVVTDGQLRLQPGTKVAVKPGVTAEEKP
jgi:multidrug efflux system membrane fusion protein